MRETLYDLIAANKRKTFFFILVTSLFLGALGYAVVEVLDWGLGGYIFFAVFIIVYNIVLYYNSDKIALKATGSVPADPDEFRMLHNVVEEVTIAAGIPKPKVYITPTPAPNAFATGRNPQNASLAVTTGLLELMNRQELQGVVAHEISHIRNYDILLMTVVAAIGGLIDDGCGHGPRAGDGEGIGDVQVADGGICLCLAPGVGNGEGVCTGSQDNGVATAPGGTSIYDGIAVGGLYSLT